MNRAIALAQAIQIACRAKEIQVLWVKDNIWNSCPYGTVPHGDLSPPELAAQRYILPNGEVTKLS